MKTMKQFFIMLAVILLPMTAHAGYGKYSDYVYGSGALRGLPILGAQITVYSAGTTSIVTIYKDVAGLYARNQTTDPILTGADGYFEFYAANGSYDLLIQIPGFASRTVSGIEILYNAIPNQALTVYIGQYSSIEDFVSQTTTSMKTLIIDEPTTLTTGTTIPDTVSIEVRYPGQINIASGQTLTIGPLFSAPSTTVFTGSGTLKFSSCPYNNIDPAWWGIDGTEDEVAINAAIDSTAENRCGTVRLTGIAYIDTNPVTIKNGIILEGTGASGFLSGTAEQVGTQLYNRTTAKPTIKISTDELLTATQIRNLAIRSAATTTDGRNGIEWETSCPVSATEQGGYGLRIDNVSFFRVDTALYINDPDGNQCQMSKIIFSNIKTDEVARVVYLNSGNSEVYSGPHNYISYLGTGFEAVRGRLDIHENFGGAYSHYPGEGDFINLPGPAVLHVQQSQAEGLVSDPTDTADFLSVTGFSYRYPIVFMGNTVDGPVALSNTSFISIGNTYDGGDVNGVGTKVLSLGDYVLAPYKFDLSAGNYATILGSMDGATLPSGFIHSDIATAVTASSTITSPAQTFHITGNNIVQTITPPWIGFSGKISIIADSGFVWGTSGNIATKGGSPAGYTVDFLYDFAEGKWYPQTTYDNSNSVINFELLTTNKTEIARVKPPVLSGSSSKQYRIECSLLAVAHTQDVSITAEFTDATTASNNIVLLNETGISANGTFPCNTISVVSPGLSDIVIYGTSTYGTDAWVSVTIEPIN